MSAERVKADRERMRPPPSVEPEGLLERITPHQADQRFAAVAVYERRPGRDASEHSARGRFYMGSGNSAGRIRA